MPKVTLSLNAVFKVIPPPFFRYLLAMDAVLEDFTITEFSIGRKHDPKTGQKSPTPNCQQGQGAIAFPSYIERH